MVAADQQLHVGYLPIFHRHGSGDRRHLCVRVLQLTRASFSLLGLHLLLVTVDEYVVVFIHLQFELAQSLIVRFIGEGRKIELGVDAERMH